MGYGIVCLFVCLFELVVKLGCLQCLENRKLPDNLLKLECINTQTHVCTHTQAVVTALLVSRLSCTN